MPQALLHSSTQTHIHTLMCTDTKTHKRTKDASKTCHPSRAHSAHQTIHRCSRIHGEHILARDGPGLCIAVPLAQGDVSKEVHHLLPTQQAHTGLRRPVGCGVWWGGGEGLACEPSRVATNTQAVGIPQSVSQITPGERARWRPCRSLQAARDVFSTSVRSKPGRG